MDLQINHRNIDMGEGIKRSRAKSYRQELVGAGGGSAFEKNLLSDIPVDEEVVLECLALPSAKMPEVGDKLDLIDRKQSAVHVFLHSRKVGEVGEQGTQFLRTEINIQKRRASHVSAVVTARSPEWGVFSVKLLSQ